MTTDFVGGLAVVVLLLLLARLVVPGLPPQSLAARLTPVDAGLAAAGIAGLVLHCASMFFEPVVSSFPGSAAVISQINSMGPASVIWYAVPSLLLLAGLRRHDTVVLAVLAVALLTVGVTMYNGAALWIHLDAVFAAGVVTAAILFLLVVPPWRTGPESLRR
ncbi:hypothetical protein [Pseudarthrobacter sp. H2]|uniref:hypothetical protein n=1 Tax=Pseudarthrobacter sp. H2 TaxID=3418415 RepID=UPI003CFBBCA8